MSIKISFMHYMKWARVMLPVVFEESELVCILFAIFSPSMSIGKRSTLANICRGCNPHPSYQGFYEPGWRTKLL